MPASCHPQSAAHGGDALHNRNLDANDIEVSIMYVGRKKKNEKRPATWERIEDTAAKDRVRFEGKEGKR